jgi:phosphoheptose isomerase
MYQILYGNQLKKTMWNNAESEFIKFRIEEYLNEVGNEIFVTTNKINDALESFIRTLKEAREQRKEVMLVGMNIDNYLLNHANTDFFKHNHLMVIPTYAPQITAFGNDYSYPDNVKEILKRRNSGKGCIIVGIQFGGSSPLLEEAFKYNQSRNGINVLVTNEGAGIDCTDLILPVATRNTAVASDIAQIILHYCSSRISFDDGHLFYDRGSESFENYCGLILHSLASQDVLCNRLTEISVLLKEKISSNKAVFVFGNGGSSAIASYLSEGLRAAAGDRKKARNIIDISSFSGSINDSIHNGHYKSDVFTGIIKSLGVEDGDVIVGISSSGSSENIVHPFSVLKDVVRVGILGFSDGGKIGKSKLNELSFIMPDAGGFRSYQRAEDGQRIAVSCILNAIL